MQHRMLSHYEVVEELGRGGMATVYRARDPRHNRDVAVKVMLPEIADSITAGRFLSEIEIAARLQHPQIVPVFDSGDVEGQLFFVMPLIEGESLRARLARERRLDVTEAVRLVREVAEALGYAHSQGVVHRDIKPENILLSRGHALLADFGVARATSVEPPEESEVQETQLATRAGAVVGTPTYMSPEQASGEQELGPATDVYSLGCVFFELLTGDPPFQGTNLQEILVKRVTTDVPSVRSRRPDAPAGCDAVLARATARETSQRFFSALEFADALGECLDGNGASAVTKVVGDRSIAVVPFDNMSPEPNDAYLADGLTEELIADLSRIPALRVIARSSSTAARARTGDLKEIAQILDVRYLLEGSVRRAGSQLRITAQLIDGTTDSHLWADKYSGSMDDVFEMQERISGSIVEELQTRLTDEERADLAAPATDAETYEIYLRAKHILGQSLLRLPEATALLEEVMERDPQFAPAYTTLGSPLLLSAMFNYIEPMTAWGRIQELADRALSANPRSGPGHALLAAVAVYRDLDWDEAKRLYQRARDLEPGAGFDNFLYAFFLAFYGDVSGGLAAAREGRRLDPLNVMGFVIESVMLAYAGDFDAALPLSKRPIELDPQFPEGYHIAGYVLLGQREYAAAAEYLEKGVELSHRGAWPMAKLGMCLIGLGRRDEALAILEELERRADEATMSFPALATLHLALGDHEQFYRWMNRAIDARDAFALGLNREYLWDAARDEPEFEKLLRRVGLTA